MRKERKEKNLSLQPSPVVRPMPPLNKPPSRCLLRRLGVSRSSLSLLTDVINEGPISIMNDQKKNTRKDEWKRTDRDCTDGANGS